MASQKIKLTDIRLPEYPHYTHGLCVTDNYPARTTLQARKHTFLGYTSEQELTDAIAIYNKLNEDFAKLSRTKRPDNYEYRLLTEQELRDLEAKVFLAELRRTLPRVLTALKPAGVIRLADLIKTFIQQELELQAADRADGD